MIDVHDRVGARFPPTLVEPAQKEIARRVVRQAGEGKITGVKGFASLARGGDILFHEVCRSQGIDTIIVLPFSPEVFLKTSVEGPESGNWLERFHRIWNETPSNAKYDLGLAQSDDAYAQCNECLLELARTHGAVQLIALWDGSGGGGRGGTSDFVERARRISGREPEIIDPKDLSGSPGR
jgi:hypothetical protein